MVMPHNLTGVGFGSFSLRLVNRVKLVSASTFVFGL
jgi:hypothetical protein